MKLSENLVHFIYGISLVLLPAAGHAGMYKWVDEEGNTHYTQSPPPDGQDFETKQPPPPVNTEEAIDSFEQKQKEGKEAREAQQKSEQEQAQTEQDKAAHEKKCDNIRLRLQSLQRPRITTVDESGNRVRMSEEERIKGIKDAEKTLSEHCK